MGQQKPLGPRTGQLRQKGGAVPVGQVACPRQNPPLEIGWVGPVAQHLPVVVGLQHHKLRPQQVLPHAGRHHPQVRGQGELPAVRRLDAEPQGLGAVVGRRERGHLHARQLEGPLQHPALHPFQGGLHGQQRPLGGKHRDAVLLGEHPHPGDVVAVLVGDEDALNRHGVYPAALEHPVQLPGAAARVDEQPRAAGAYVIAVPSAAGEQRAKPCHPIHPFPKQKSCRITCRSPWTFFYLCQPIFPITCSGSWLR